MSTFQYIIQIHKPNDGFEIFRAGEVNGQQWLATGMGAATKTPELLNRLEAWLSSTPNLTAESFQNVLSDYLAWYRQRYLETKQKDCPLGDEEIIKSIGVVVAHKNGNYTTISIGECLISQLQAQTQQLKMIPQGFESSQLKARDILILDPKRADIATGIRNTLKSQIGSTTTLSLEGPYPFAIWQANELETHKLEPSTLKKKPLLWGSLALLILSGGIFLFQRSAVLPWLKAVEVITVTEDSVETQEILSPANLDTAQATGEAAVVSPPPLEKIPSPRPESAESSDENLQEKAQLYLIEANKAFNLAKAKEADGNGEEALKLYKRAKEQYEEVLKFSPDQETKINPNLNFSKRKIQLLGESATF